MKFHIIQRIYGQVQELDVIENKTLNCPKFQSLKFFDLHIHSFNDMNELNIELKRLERF